VNKLAPPQAGGSSTEATGSRVEIERLAEQSTAQLLKMCQHILRDREEADDHSMSTAGSAFGTTLPASKEGVDMGEREREREKRREREREEARERGAARMKKSG
jgi:UDP-N-acetylenolpyruvoylglucosamine reductase